MIDYQSIQQTLDQIGVQIILTDESFQVIDKSERVQLPPSETGSWNGQPLAEFAPELIGSEDLLEAILRGELPSLCLPMVNRELDDGRLLYVNLTALPHWGPDGQIDGIMYVAEDITDQARIEQTVMQHRNELALLHRELETKNLQLAAANVELHKLDEIKSKFVSIAAHELRSPLSTMGGYLDLLGDEEFGGLSELQTDFVAAIRRATDRLLEIIEKLLDLTLIAAGRIDLMMSLTNTVELLDAAEREILPSAQAKSLFLDVSAEEGLPPVLCDPARSMQILHNLILNAVKYTKTGGHISVRATRSTDPAYIQIAVKDDGIGIPIDDQEHIFESFFRAGNAYKAEAMGTGLGLNISRSLVELHGGEICFESVPGQGTTFYFTLPAVSDSTPSSPLNPA